MRLFPVFIPARIVALVFSEILLIFGAFILVAYYVLPVDPVDYLYDGGYLNISLVVASILIGLYLNNLYAEIHVKSRIVLLQQLCLSIGIAFLLQGMISYVNPDLRMPIRLMAFGSLLAMTAIFFWRMVFSVYVLKVVGGERLLLVGGSSVLLNIAQHIDDHPEMGLVVTGYVDDIQEPETELPGGKILGPLASLREVVAAIRPSRIVVGMFERRNRMPVGELLEMRFAGHVIEEAATLYERVCGRVCIKELRPSQLIYTGELGPRRGTLLFQSLMNIVAASVLFILTIPLMLLTVAAIRLSSAGPVLYRQVRIGLGEVPFTLYKFRSMRADVEGGNGAAWGTAEDPRLTRVGRIVRELRLDELPQLVNVLRGEMSIVGPRPERPEFVKALSEQLPYYRQRHCVRPGMTGWAQIKTPSGGALDETVTRLEYDLFYIKNMSLSLDTYIIFQTMKAVLLPEASR
jgi:sugar transferase (PEP-CTERM system associated)